MAWQPREPEDNADVPWFELDISKLDPGDGTALPRLFVTRFKSSSTDSEDFIHDPLTALILAQKDGKIQDPGGQQVNDLEITSEFRVTTLVVNHHETLSKTHLIASASVDTQGSTVGVTVTKKKKPGD